MKEFKLSTKQVLELFEVLVIAPDLDKKDIEKCQKYARLFSTWVAKQMFEGQPDLSVYNACRKAVNEHNFDGKCKEPCRQAILGNMQRKFKELKQEGTNEK